MLQKISFLGLYLLYVLALGATCEQLDGAMQQLPLPLTRRGGMDGGICGDLLDHLAITDRLNGDTRLELGTLGAALAYWWEPHSRAVPPPQRLTKRAL